MNIKNNTVNLKEAYEIAKVQRGYALGKNRPLSDKEVAELVLLRTPSLINKVLTDTATSKPVLTAIIKFITDTSSDLSEKYRVTMLLKTQEEAE